MKNLTDEQRLAILDMAHEEYGTFEINIDDGAAISESASNGTWVQAWVWVDFAGTKFDKEASE